MESLDSCTKSVSDGGDNRRTINHFAYCALWQTTVRVFFLPLLSGNKQSLTAGSSDESFKREVLRTVPPGPTTEKLTMESDKK